MKRNDLANLSVFVGFALVVWLVGGNARRVEALESNPGARHVLHLDFDGRTIQAVDFGGIVVSSTIPPFDLDGQPGQRSSEERDEVEEIWRRVAEDYAPFDVNVTTTSPVGFVPGQFVGVRISIGGDQSHIGRAQRGYDVRGTSSRGSALGVVALEYHGTLQAARGLAQTASHEAGHIFGSWSAMPGLSHFTTASPAGRTPIMGSHQDRRDTWWKAQTILGLDLAGNSIYGEQDDIAILMAALGARGADHAGVPERGTPLQEAASGVLEGTGTITMNRASWPRSCAPWGDPGGICPARTDETQIPEQKDFFRFRANTGRFWAYVHTASGPDDIDGTVANLDAEIELWRLESGQWVELISSGTLQSVADLWAGLSHRVASGESGIYAVAAKSHGSYGDLGGYTIRVEGPGVEEYVLSARLERVEWQGPVVTQVTPESVRGGDVVRVEGQGFESGGGFAPSLFSSRVEWNGAPLQTTVLSSTELTFQMPHDAFCGFGDLRVVNPAGLARIDGAAPRRVSPPVSVEVLGGCRLRPDVYLHRLTPSSGPVGTRVLVEGFGLQRPNRTGLGGSVVLFGGEPVDFRLESDGRLSFEVPAELSCGTYEVQVTTSNLRALPLKLPQPELPDLGVLPDLLGNVVDRVEPESPAKIESPLVREDPPVLPQPAPEIVRPSGTLASNILLFEVVGCRLSREPPAADERELERGLRFQRGDTNGDGAVDLSDARTILNVLFVGTTKLSCRKSADVDDNAELNQTDAMYLLNWLFRGGPEVAAPLHRCGDDPTGDDLTCEAYSACD